MSHEQKLPKTASFFRAWVVDHYSGIVIEVIGGPWSGEEQAEEALEGYFKNNPPQTVVDYDIGGYIEKVNVILKVNPKE